MADSSPSMHRVLLVDPDPESLESLEKGLQDSKLDLIATGSIAEALAFTERDPPRLIVSELVLPDGSGFGLCRRLRESGRLLSIPIVLVSRWSLEADRILAFECGADDFVAKPFFARELSSRVRALLRRSALPQTQTDSDATPDAADPVAIDLDRDEVFVAGARVALTPREFALLAAMVRRRGRVLSREELIEQAWGNGEVPSARSVDAHVKSLRRKLGESRDAIETVRGLGYRFSETLAPSLGGRLDPGR